REIGGDAPIAEGTIEPGHIRRSISACRRDQAHACRPAAGELENKIVEKGIFGFHQEPSSTESYDVTTRRHPATLSRRRGHDSRRWSLAVTSSSRAPRRCTSHRCR